MNSISSIDGIGRNQAIFSIYKNSNANKYLNNIEDFKNSVLGAKNNSKTTVKDGVNKSSELNNNSKSQNVNEIKSTFNLLSKSENLNNLFENQSNSDESFISQTITDIYNNAAENRQNTANFSNNQAIKAYTMINNLSFNNRPQLFNVYV